MATAPGIEQRKRLLEGGFSADQVVEWEASTRDRFAKGGFSNQQIENYFGAGKVSDQAIMGLRDIQFPATTGEDGADDGSQQKEAEGFMQSLSAGFQGSITGLQKNQALPELVLDDEANFVEVFGAALGQFGGDLPVSLPSFIGGAAIGGGVGGTAGATASRNPIAALVSGGVGAAVGGEATSGFVTEATRQALINFYRDNRNAGVEVDAKDFSNRLIAAVFDISVLKQGAKGGVVGAATGATAGLSRIFLRPVIGNPALRQAVVSSAEVTTAVTASAALEGQLPRAQDFAAGAALVLGLDVAIRVGGAASKPINDAAKALEDHYARTGERPEVAADRARKDPVFRQEILGNQRSEEAIPSGAIKGEISIAKNDDVSAIKTDKKEITIIENTPETPNAVEGAKASKKLKGDTQHSAILGAARPSSIINVSVPDVPAPKGGKIDVVADARASIRDKVKNPKRRTNVKEVIDDLRYDFINDLQYAVSQSEAAFEGATGRRLSVEENPGELMRLAFGAHAVADLAVRKGIYKANGRKISASFDEIVNGAKDVDHFMEYAIARRVLEKEKQGLDTGFDPTKADVVVKDADANTDFKSRLAQLQQWANLQLLDAQKAGLLSEKDVKTIIRHNQDYVPFSRVLDADKAPPGATARGLPVRKPTKKFTGSENDILDPFEVMTKNRYAIQQIIENNSARQRLVDFNDQLPDEFKLFTPAKKRIKTTEIAETDSQVKKFLEDNGLDIEDATGLHIYRAVNKDLSGSDFIVFKDGKPQIFTAKDPKLVMAMQRLDVTTQNALIKMLRVPSAMLRAGVTLNPEFSLKASFRDQLGALLINDFTVVPFLDLYRGLMRLVPGPEGQMDPLVIKWINEGGANSALLAVDARMLNDALSDRPQTIRERAWNAVLFPLRKMAGFSQLMENGMRVGRFERALDEGLSPQAAAIQSRDINLDFGRMGARVRSYNMITTWLGAGINGIDRFQTSFTRNPAGTLMKTAAAITLPSMILYLANRDEVWYQELPEWERMMFWHFPIGQNPDGSPEKVLRLPMPHQFGTIFGYLPTKMFEEMEKAEPKVGKAFREAIATTYNIPLIPTLLTPLVEIGLNHSFFTGNPIVSKAQERVLPEFQYSPHTTQLSRKIAQLLANVPGGIVSERFTSPIAIEHMVRGYAGTLGQLALQELDLNLKKLGFLENISQPDPGLSDHPMYGAFFSRNESARQSITTFYENAEDMERIVNTIRQEAVRGNPAEIERILRRRGFPALKPGKVKRALGNLRKMGYAIHFDKTMKGDEKRQLINEINKQQVAIARAFNAQVENFKRLEKARRKAERKNK